MRPPLRFPFPVPRPRDRLLRRAALTGGATAAGQAVLLLLTPLLSRLYGPADFGAFAVFATLAALFNAVAFLRLETSLPLCRERELPAACSALVLCGLFTATLAAAGTWTAAVLAPGLPPEVRAVLGIAPPALVAAVLSLPLSGLLVRRGDFRGYALLGGLRLSAQGAGQLLLGLLGAGASGLVLGYAGGVLLAAVVVWRRALGRRGRVRIRPRAAWRYVKRHAEHPRYVAPGALAHAAAQFLPATLLALLFDLRLAGLYALAQRLLGVPIRFVAQAVAQALLSELARGETRDPARRVDRLLVALAAFGLPVLALPLLPGEDGWVRILGPGWDGFHRMLALLAPLFFARFLAESVWNVLVVGGRRLFLAATLAQLLVLLAAYGGVALVRGPAPVAVGLHVAGGTVLAFATVLAVRRTARDLPGRERAARGGPSSAGNAASGALTRAGGRRPPPGG